jgi:hypothetical protein
MPLSGRQEDIRMKGALSLAKHINWRTKKLEHKPYVRIAEDLNTFGVSPYYVGTIWRKHKQDILDIVNRDLVKSLQTLPGSGRRCKISVVELYAKVKAVPFHFHKNVRTLASKVGIPKSMIHDALKKGLLKHTRNTIRPRRRPSRCQCRPQQRRRPSASSPLPSPSAIDVVAHLRHHRCRPTLPLLSIRDIAITVAVFVRHRRRRPSATSPSPLPFAIAVAVIVLVLRHAVAIDHSHPIFFLIVT